MAQVLLAILGISLIVIIHEGGHYLVARAFGIRVTHFSIGFGPALLKFRPRGSETTFQICVVPFLAYVKMAGGDPTKEPDPTDRGLFENKGVLARGLTLLGGPLANYLAASLLIFTLALAGWREEVPTSPMVVATLEAGGPAEAAGVRSGDVIVSAGGTAIRDIRDLGDVNRARAGQSTDYVVRRGDHVLPPMMIVPRDVGGRGIIGVGPKTETITRHLGLGEAARLAVVLPVSFTASNLRAFADLARHRTTEGLTGPVGMVKTVAREADRGPYAFVSTLVMISIALGFFNLLPLPFLDGGRLVFVVLEAVSRRRPNRTVEALVHAVGLLLLLGMTALITLRDVVS